MPACRIEDENGAVQWRGSLHFMLANNEFTSAEAARYVLAPLRKNGRVTLGGGAAPAFVVCLVD